MWIAYQKLCIREVAVDSIAGGMRKRTKLRAIWECTAAAAPNITSRERFSWYSTRSNGIREARSKNAMRKQGERTARRQAGVRPASA